MAALLCGCALVGLIGPGRAGAEEDTTPLPPITVEGSADSTSLIAAQVTSGGKLATATLDTPATVSVITAREMATRGAKSVEQVLAYSPGIVTDFYGGDDRFDYFKIRGFNAYTYRDGLLIGSNFGGIREDPYAYERVEVLKGAVSSGFGVSDPGGAVNYVTKLPKSGRWGEVYSTLGTQAQKELGFDFGDDLGAEGRLSYRLTGKLRDAETELDHGRDDAWFLMGGLSWRATEASTLSLVFDHLSRDGVTGPGLPVGQDLARSLFLGEPDFNYRGTERSTATVKFDHDFGTGLSLNATLRWSDTDSDFGYAYVAGTVPGTTTASRYFFANDSAQREVIGDANLRYETRFGVVASRSVLGVEWRDSSAQTANWWAVAPGIDWTNPVYTGGIDLATLAPYVSTDRDTTGKAAYLQQEFTLSERLIASFGLRHDWIDVTQTNRLSQAVSTGAYSETTGRAGLTWKVTPDVSVYGAYATSVVPAAGLTLDPEAGRQYELGVKYAPAGMRALFTAAVFDLAKTNMTRTNPVTLLPDTIGEARVRGLELEAKGDLTERLSLTAGYSWLDSEIVENGTSGNEGNALSFVPRSSASVWVNYRLPGAALGETTLGLGARYTGAYWMNDANTQKAESAVIYDAAISWQVSEKTQLALNVANLLDEKHVAYGGFGADYTNSERTVTATLRQSW